MPKFLGLFLSRQWLSWRVGCRFLFAIRTVSASDAKACTNIRRSPLARQTMTRSHPIDRWSVVERTCVPHSLPTKAHCGKTLKTSGVSFGNLGDPDNKVRLGLCVCDAILCMGTDQFSLEVAIGLGQVWMFNEVVPK